MTARTLVATVIVFFSAISLVSAQELRDKELKPAYDLTTIQMPVEIVSMKLKGQEIAPGQKIKGDDDWLKGLSFTVRNISDRAIAHIVVGIRLDPNSEPVRLVVFALSYGVDYSRGEARSGYSPLPIQPDQTVELVLTEQRYPNFLQILSLGGVPRNFDVAKYYVERVSFEDDTNIIWQGGYLKRKNPGEIGRFDIIAPYKLPAKR